LRFVLMGLSTGPDQDIADNYSCEVSLNKAFELSLLHLGMGNKLIDLELAS